MAIFERISRIIKSNINWMLDKVEPAENELESKIKELEEVIHEGRESAAMYGATYRRLENELKSLKNKRDSLTQQAQSAIKANDENHARQLVTEKVKITERISQLTPGVEDGKKSYAMLSDNIIKLQDQLREAKTKLCNLRARKDLADAQNSFDKKLGFASITKSNPALDRLEDEVMTSEAEVEIRQQMRGETLTDVELQQRSRELQIEAEMQALKENLDNSNEK
ncbi:MAG: PspA/IM30 family protein [Phycisphaerae bacterium]|nr:PspA/IM30 family protein [Phycisphaerae bacterium]